MLFLYVFVLSQVFYQVTTDRNEGFVPPLITMDQLEKISKVLLKPPGNEAIYDENVLSDQFNEERYFLRKKKRRMSKGCRNSLRELHRKLKELFIIYCVAGFTKMNEEKQLEKVCTENQKCVLAIYLS